MAHLAFPRNIARKRGGFLLPPFMLLLALALLAGSFVGYVLWPTWPDAPAPLNAPALPITIEGVLFEVPPGAIRAAVQRHPGPHERVDLAFEWPSLKPPPDGAPQQQPPGAAETAKPEVRLFVTIAPLGSALPPKERLRSVYPRYAEPKANAGADGLAILPFRTDSPYRGEDLVYFAERPESFFARCTRQTGIVGGNCIADRDIGGVVVTLRFARDLLKDWRSLAAGFDRLLAQLRNR
jgi:hypothetical protein